MTPNRGFSAIIILVILGVLVVGGGIATFMYFTNQANPLLQSSAYTPAPQTIKLPKSDTETGFSAPTATSSPNLGAPTAPPVAIPAGPSLLIPTGSVDVQTALSADKKTLTANFRSSSRFVGITAISYNLTYTADAGARAVQGTFNVAGSTVTTDTSGYQVIQKVLTLGTCSNGACVYDTNPTNLRLSVSTK